MEENLGGGVNYCLGTRLAESQRTINSFRFSFFTFPYLQCCPLVKGRLCQSVERDAGPSEQARLRGH